MSLSATAPADVSPAELDLADPSPSADDDARPQGLTESFLLRHDVDQRHLWEIAAARAGMRLSPWMRRALGHVAAQDRPHRRTDANQPELPFPPSQRALPGVSQ